jgi:hypothetical protein
MAGAVSVAHRESLLTGEWSMCATCGCSGKKAAKKPAKKAPKKK